MKKEEITFTDVVEFIARNSDNTLRMDKLNKLTFPFTSKYTLQSGFAIPKSETKHYTVEELEAEVNKPLWLWDQPAYDDYRDVVEAPMWKYED